MVLSDSSAMEQRIAIYLRVSTTAQDHDSQRNELTEYCQRRGWANVHWFTDTASGAKQNREGLTRLMEQVRRGKVDVVVAFKLDRLARSLSHLAQIIAELQAHAVALVVPSQGIDTYNTNPAAQLQLNILAAVAQFERELITERVNAGVRAGKGARGEVRTALNHTGSRREGQIAGSTGVKRSGHQPNAEHPVFHRWRDGAGGEGGSLIEPRAVGFITANGLPVILKFFGQWQTPHNPTDYSPEHCSPRDD